MKYLFIGLLLVMLLAGWQAAHCRRNDHPDPESIVNTPLPSHRRPALQPRRLLPRHFHSTLTTPTPAKYGPSNFPRTSIH
jgi:hypothetical protein